ncbi:MAG: ATP-dependent DNA helicase RecG [Bacteroidota bacterium]
MSRFLDTSIEFIKGIGPQKAQLFKEELGVESFDDLLNFFPFRYEDRSQISKISSLEDDSPNVLLVGTVLNKSIIGMKRQKRLVTTFDDGSGKIELVWFKGVPWMDKKVLPGTRYLVYGKPTLFNRKFNIAHPEIEVYSSASINNGGFVPVYHTTEKLRRKFLDSRGLAKIIQPFSIEKSKLLNENLSEALLQKTKVISRADAYSQVHAPKDHKEAKEARFRLKLEELFFIQLKLLLQKEGRKEVFKGPVFNKAKLLTRFYKEIIPFELTNAQKNVVKEIYADMNSGTQMNRLLQGDVGSGKTIVSFICMLLAIDGEAQCALMAPTEILAQQHFQNISGFCEKLDIEVLLLTGSTKKAERQTIDEKLRSGSLGILVGTHALLEDKVVFRNLGLAVIDEQHRFGVAQRAKLWNKNKSLSPHILVMTATPIPRTLAMTLYGDLDVSVIDELPKGRKPIETKHYFDSGRLKVFGFLKKQIESGNQVYIVYPLIEESEKLDLKDLMDGYESVRRSFPELPIGVLHGKMKPQDKDWEMERFKKGETKILVSTTVIEVGVDVPNASVMVIENAEKFGLAQLHQLRGRVGRGGTQSYCILMSGNKLSKDARTRIQTMVRTNNGFEIADVDLSLRGPGEISGTRQSGGLELKIANLSEDGKLLQAARNLAKDVIEEDPKLEMLQNKMMKLHIDRMNASSINWNRIS